MPSINLIKQRCKNIIGITILYFYLYKPVFLAFPQLTGPTISLVIIILFIILRNKLKKYLYTFRKELSLYLLLLSFAIIRFCFGGEPFYISIHANFIIDTILGSMIIIYLQKNPSQIIRWTLSASLIASLISFFALILPPFKDWLFHIFSYDEKLLLFSWRGYGLSNDLLFTYAVTQAFILCYLFEKGEKFLILLFFIPFMISIFFNARIGLVPLVLYLSYKIIIERKIKILLYGLTLTVTLLVIILQSNIYDQYEHTINWIFESFADISNTILGTSFHVQTSNMNVLNKMIIFPENFGEWLWGKGISLFNLQRGNSDIGYIIQLNYGGIGYLCLLFSFYLLIAYRFIKVNKNWYGLIFPITILLLNYKGDVFQSSSFMKLFMLIYIITILQYEKEKNHSSLSLYSQQKLT